MSDTTDKPRWLARFTYKGILGPVVIDHAFEELLELHHIIDRGLSSDALTDIVVRRQRPPALTSKPRSEHKVTK